MRLFLSMASHLIRIITYKRKSSKEEVDREEPLARQNLLIDQARKWKGEIDQEQIVAELSDENLSGSTDRRPGLQRLIQMARQNEYQRAYIGITSRLFRDLPNGPEILFELREVLGKEIIFGDVLIPQNDPYYKRYEAQRFLDAQNTSIEGSIGAKTGHAQLFKDGFKVGGRARYGYKLKRIARGRDRKGAIKYNSQIVPNERAFVIANEILTTYAKGKPGAKAISSDLTRRAIPPPSAWDSWGNLLAKCGECNFSINESARIKDQLVICPLCSQPVLSPKHQPWNKAHILSIINEVEWTYSGHYRANYCATRIKHGVMAGRYKGGLWEGDDYKGQRLKPISEWRIRRDNHIPAITSDICAKVLERRNDPRKKTPGGRRRSREQPFPIICGICGSLYSRRGDGLLSCSGRDRQLTDCKNRGIKQDTIYPFVIKAMIRQFRLLSDPEKILSRIREIEKEKKRTMPLALSRAKKELAKRKASVNLHFNLYAEGKLTKEKFYEGMEENKKKTGQLNELILQLKYESLTDTTLFNGGDIFGLLYTGDVLKDPETIPIITPHIKKLICYVTLQPLDKQNKKRVVGISYNPILSQALKSGVPKGI